jgi:hypothetical protein
MKNQDAVKSATSVCFLDLKMKEKNKEENWAVTNYPYNLNTYTIPPHRRGRSRAEKMC